MAGATATVAVEILDASDGVQFEGTRQVDADAFRASHAVDELIDVPLARLTDGPYILNVSVTAGDEQTRQDLLFRIRPGAG